MIKTTERPFIQIITEAPESANTRKVNLLETKERLLEMHMRAYFPQSSRSITYANQYWEANQRRIGQLMSEINKLKLFGVSRRKILYIGRFKLEVG